MKTSSVQLAESLGYKKVSSTESSFTMCDGEHHIIGRKGDGVPEHIMSVAFGKLTRCTCDENVSS